MKYIIGIVIGVSLAMGGVVWAQNSDGMGIVNSVEVGWGKLYKIYDEHNGAVCYVLTAGTYQGGVSCLK